MSYQGMIKHSVDLKNNYPRKIIKVKISGLFQKNKNKILIWKMSKLWKEIIINKAVKIKRNLKSIQ